ncbi:DUF2202 domain-containing protein [Marinobacter persicus]|uniref:DUF2202 domain-containing protein n=1 Tax=Marinobacter persicus TaxID=930118 RepID=A0A2S6G447_9GAMM|nr:DUF2202 domain-containing protein [Marinobacter persicus]PPK50585.1 hypothetical protein BY455_12337 [Marinobacter persicus]PPK53860.1 hypothetical protein B0H24_102337 [Marinobacter persicus]PPK57096.1 hypothetical protein BY454_12537 [Marinobacter persicus]
MNVKTLLCATLITSTIASSAVIAAGAPGQGRQDTTDSSTTDSVLDVSSELTGTETDDLRYMREEEKLARDVYMTMDEYWGNQTLVFAQIALSEDTHTSTVDYLLDKFGVEDPVVSDTIGEFTNEELQALYDKLIAEGANSFINALYVGALIEEKDMRDILAAINRTDERPIILAYSNLLDGSKSHLRAFVKVIEDQGLTYEAQLLEPEEVELILEDEGSL